MSSERKPEGYIEGLSSFFERIGSWSYDHRWIVLAISVLVLAVCMVFASRARFDNSFEAYFDQSDPVYVAYKQLREDFGSPFPLLQQHQRVLGAPRPVPRHARARGGATPSSATVSLPLAPLPMARHSSLLRSCS